MAAESATNVNKSKEKSEFQKACDELKQALDDEKNDYELIRQTIGSWPKHTNPNKHCAAGATIVKPHHCSNKIRQKLATFIPNHCTLDYCCFSKGDNCCSNFNMSEFQNMYSISLPALFAFSANCDQKAASLILKQVIGIKQFDFSVIFGCCGAEQKFWTKMIGDSAFVKAMGTSQRTDCMTFAPLIAVKLNENGLVVLKATKGLLGIGFGNLIEDPRRKTKRKKKEKIEGNSMIFFRDDNIDDIEIMFYGKNGVTNNDFGISFESNNLTKNGYDNPLVLCSQSHAVHAENIESFEHYSTLSVNESVHYADSYYLSIPPMPLMPPLPSMGYAHSSFPNTYSCVHDGYYPVANFRFNPYQYYK